ncbi:hypothetical protein C440_06857 [Haloferax mucosum ATCC BAA-1512]|uniref:Periplasmic copper-binding protein NosD beta helix domain-containing protein n=2 Tax=Haloferax mucosum TaxID=403181 RepID=M0IH32_9EURY|nr:hypothetical protein C440_06857 [Haloferax mucosum ATCC BAA-1512]
MLTVGSRLVSGDATITDPGRYHLDGDIDSLEIAAERVRVDGRGYTVRGVTKISGRNLSISALVMGDGVRIFDARQVSLDDSRIDVRANPQSDVDTLLSIEDSEHCFVTDTVLYATDRTGVQLTNAHDNRFRSCTMTSAIVVSLTNADRNRFSDCELLSEESVVVLHESDRNVFKSNVIDSESPGFTLVNSEQNRLIKNELDILVAGFVLRESDRNLVLKNTVDGDLGARGAILADADDNRLVHNDFCDLVLPHADDPLVVVSPDSTGNTIRNVECGADSEPSSETPPPMTPKPAEPTPETPKQPKHDELYCTVSDE